MDRLINNSSAFLKNQKEQILNSLPVTSDIFLPTNKVPLEEQIEGLKHVNEIYRNDFKNYYSKKIRLLKSGLKGSKRCFLIGNGPSLNKTDLSYLENEITFSVNSFFLKSNHLSWKPTFHIVEDHLVAEDRKNELVNFKGPIKLYPAYLGYCFPKSEDTIFYNHRPRISYPDGFDFSTQADKITYTGCTVIFSALQIAAYLGFQEIYLIGVDASYEIPKVATENNDYGISVLDMECDDPNHFDPDYFGKGYRWHNPQVDKMIQAFTEARNVCEKTGIEIYNATIGGKLEVFKRVNYENLFNNVSESTELPKILIIDFTKFGESSATGELKSKYFQKWDQKDIFHVHGKLGSHNIINFTHVATVENSSISGIKNKIEEFSPDVILYRPVSNNLDLHRLAMELISSLKIPYSIWLMDDWITRLKHQDPTLGKVINEQIKNLLQHANSRFAISEAMAGVFGSRYGVNFDVFHNGIDTEKDYFNKYKYQNDIKSTSKTSIRYSGGLSEDMNLKSLIDVALAINKLPKSLDIKFEIRCQKHCYKLALETFKNYEFVTISLTNDDIGDYYNWIGAADILLICNNFDDTSKRYIRYSFANKIPEYLMAGKPIIAYGPDGLETMDYLDKIKSINRLRDQCIIELSKKIQYLINSPGLRKKQGALNKVYAENNLNFDKYRERFENSLANIAKSDFKGFAYIPEYSKSNKSNKNNKKIGKIKNFKKYAYLNKNFKRYLLSWKGLVGLISSIVTSISVVFLLLDISLFLNIISFLVLIASQMVCILLIAHLSANMDNKFN
jgi:hypothetical protein